MIIESIKVPVPRDGNGKDGRPLIVPRGGGKVVAHKRTTNFTKALEDSSGLDIWKRRMALKGALHADNELVAIDWKHPEAWRHGNELAEVAHDLAGGNDSSRRGTYLHELTEVVDAGLPMPDTASMLDMIIMASYAEITRSYRHERMESFVVCEELRVAGTYDRLMRVPDGYCPTAGCTKLHIEDLKTGKDSTYGKLTWPMQMAIYSRSVPYDPSPHPAPRRVRGDDGEWRRWRATQVLPEVAALCYPKSAPEICQDWGFIVHLPQNGDSYQVFAADLNKGWQLALLCKAVYTARLIKGTMFAHNPEEKS